MQQGRGGSALAWSAFDVVVFDECHHVLKDHSYRKLAVKLARACTDLARPPRVIGLTASVTYAVGNKRIANSMERLCSGMRIDAIETATSTELVDSGYHALGTVPDLPNFDLPIEDLVPAGGIPANERKPHLMTQSFFRRISRGDATPFARDIISVIRAKEAAVLKADPSFKSPLEILSVREWGAYAHNQLAISPLYADLEHWYEALRILVVSWEEQPESAVEFLRMSGVLPPEPGGWPPALLPYASPTTVRFERLKDVLIYQFDQRSKNFRGILFVQQKVMTHIIDHIIRTDEELCQRFKPVCLYAIGAATPSLSLSKKEANQRIEAFRKGEANILICTAVAEEGMDVPQANCVIRFDPIQHAVSFVQGRGRARQKDSSFVILSEQEGRSAEALAKAEQQQLKIAQTFQPREGGGTIDQQKEIAAQMSRERGARDVLSAAFAAGDGSAEASAVSTLNLYCKKTKVVLEEGFQPGKGGSTWVCDLQYFSPLRNIGTSASAAGKNEAKKDAAFKLLKLLVAQCK